MKTPLACILHFITISRKWMLFLPFFLITAYLGGSAETEQIGSDMVSAVGATRTPIVIRVPRPAFMSTVTPTVTPAVPTITAPATSAKPGPSTDLTASVGQSPAAFQTSELYRGIRPVTYVEDTCEYLRDKWDPAKSAPGTFVAPIMYHTISPTNRTGASTWTPSSYFYRTINEAKRLGFETVTAAEVADFLEHNARIPERSLMLILDDRRLGSAEDYMLPTARRNGWTYTMAWNISDTDNRPGLWERVEGWHETGLVDAQSHGLRHRYMTVRTPEKKIRSELFGPIPIHEEHFGYRPTAFIWPGGLFTKKTVEIAREADYRLAFTIYPRGPIMYNWIPQGKEERDIGDPIMTLPRYWGYPGVIEELKDAVAISEAARQHALEQYPAEAAYFELNCGGSLPQPAFVQGAIGVAESGS